MTKGQALYSKVAEEIRAMIEARVFKPGEKLPSVRAMSRAKGVSIPTATAAYQYLEDQNLIQARPQSGFFVLETEGPRTAQANPDQAGNLRNSDYARIIERTRDDENLAQFDMAMQDDAFFPVHRLSSLMSVLLRRDPGMLGRSTLALGDLGLRTEIAKRLVNWNCFLDPDDIVITNGGLEAINLALRTVTRPGDHVAVECPAYYGFLNLIESCGLHAVEIPCSPSLGMDLDALESALARHPIKACLMCTTVSNPMGVTLPLEGKHRLLALLGKAGVPLIEDATFADLHYGMAPVAAQGLGKDQDVILCASLTKTLAPGFRLGWVNGGRFKRETSALKKILSGDQPEILQCTLRMYLESGGYERHLRRARQNLASRMQGTIAALKATFPEGTRWTEPSGGFLLWVELPRAIDWDILQGGASRLGLRVAPGRLFSRTPGFERHFRLNFAQADAAKLVEHLGQFGAFLTEACRCGG